MLGRLAGTRGLRLMLTSSGMKTGDGGEGGFGSGYIDLDAGVIFGTNTYCKRKYLLLHSPKKRAFGLYLYK